MPLKSLLLAVHLRVIGEATGRADVVSGLVVGCRPDEADADRTLGLFLNTVPVAAELGGLSLADLAREVWRLEQGLMAHRRFPLADMERAVGRGRLFDAFFNFSRFHRVDGAANPERKSVEITAGRVIPVDVAFALAVDFELDADGRELLLTLQYDGVRLSEERMLALGARMAELLASDVTAPLATSWAEAQAETDPWTERVAAVWTDLLGAAPLDERTRFADAGGDSLLALRFVTALRRHGGELGLAEFRAPTTFGDLVRRGRELAGRDVG